MFKRIIRALRKPIILKVNLMLFPGEKLDEEEKRLSNKLNRKVILVDSRTERV